MTRQTKPAPIGGVLSYSVPQLAIVTGLSERQVYKHIERGDLSAKFSGSKRLIPADEARRFIENLPDEDLGPLR